MVKTFTYNQGANAAVGAGRPAELRGTWPRDSPMPGGTFMPEKRKENMRGNNDHNKLSDNHYIYIYIYMIIIYIHIFVQSYIHDLNNK